MHGIGGPQKELLAMTCFYDLRGPPDVGEGLGDARKGRRLQLMRKYSNIWKNITTTAHFHALMTVPSSQNELSDSQRLCPATSEEYEGI